MWVLWASLVAAAGEAEAEQHRLREELSTLKGGTTDKRLGPNIFWNVLHGLRGSAEEADQESGMAPADRLDKAAVAAILALLLLAGLIILLVSV